MKISKELAKGSTPLLVLSLLNDEDMYGYRIIKELEIRSEFVFSLKEGTLYPILHTLEKEGLLTSYWMNDTARKRKYYRITEKGIKILNNNKDEWKIYNKAVQ